MTYAELKASLTVFGFSEHDQLTMAQIKRRHRELSRSNHPDLQGNEVAMQEVNSAAALLLAYLTTYRFAFSEEEFYRQSPDELLRMQFSKDPWGT
jgi:hypothetical protein